MRRVRISLLVVCVLSPIALAAADVPLWKRFEVEFTSAGDYENPVQDVQVEVEFTSPSGKKQTVPAFWVGGNIRKVRFAPDEVGKWTYRSRSSPDSDAGLDRQSGEFNCVPYRGPNGLFRHGAIRLSENRRHLAHADGTPFFWLADTAWNGPLKAAAKDWSVYLGDRVAKGFTVVQFVATQFLAAAGNADARPAYLGREKIVLDPVFFQWMDERIDAINDSGLVAAPVLLWAAPWNKLTLALNPGTYLPDDQNILLARHMVARWSAHQVIWILGGDADYRREKAKRWKPIGREVFGEHPARLATMHPAGQQWVADEFRHEPWFSFNGYQSGHGDSDDHLRWLVEGPPSLEWMKEPHHPVINLEPNYEAHLGYTFRKPFDAHAVRRAAYWSLLVSPTAGVTYGAHGVWGWQLLRGLPMAHPRTGVAAPWYEAIHLPGSTGMKHLKNFFSSIPWWKLVPDPGLVAEQPGKDSPAKFIASARSEEGDLAVVYIPEDGSVTLRADRLKTPLRAEWFNPATGARTAARKVSSAATQHFKAPGRGDWVLLLQRSAR